MGLYILKPGKPQDLWPGPSPGRSSTPTAGRPQAWPGKDWGLCVCELPLWKVSCGIADPIPYRLLLPSPVAHGKQVPTVTLQSWESSVGVSHTPGRSPQIIAVHEGSEVCTQFTSRSHTEVKCLTISSSESR